jgi:hypothetical protein
MINLTSIGITYKIQKIIKLNIEKREKLIVWLSGYNISCRFERNLVAQDFV